MHDLDDQFAFDDDFTDQRTEDDLLDADDKNEFDKKIFKLTNSVEPLFY